jgi:Ni/Co efflux regulator RcnB
MTILKQISTISCAAALLVFTAGFANAQAEHGQPQQAAHGHNDGHFESNDRGNLQKHYQTQARTWNNKPNRPSFSQGQAIPRNYRMQPVPSSYWQGNTPPRGYTYGYYDGYVVSYNPTTRIIADVLDLATGN